MLILGGKTNQFNDGDCSFNIAFKFFIYDVSIKIRMILSWHVIPVKLQHGLHRLYRSGVAHAGNRADQVIHAPARLTVLTYLYVVESADFVFLKNMTGLTWGNLSTHLSRLEEAGYVTIEKEFKGKKPHTMVRLTGKGRAAFREYKRTMQQVLDDLPD